MLYVVETFLNMSIKPLQQHRITSRQSPLSAKHVVPIIQLDVAQAAEHKSSNGSLDPGKKKILNLLRNLQAGQQRFRNSLIFRPKMVTWRAGLFRF